MRLVSRLVSITISLIPIAGCQLGGTPMPVRLPEESQKHVNDAWNNALGPPARLDRDLLLDVMISYDMYWTGVDRVRATVEKDLSPGRVVMELQYDRNQPPETDAFTVTCFDQYNAVQRVEHFSRADIDARRSALNGGELTLIADPNNVTEEEKAAMQQQADRIRERQLQIIAATQPAE